jgi:predicted metal-binding membrane protein
LRFREQHAICGAYQLTPVKDRCLARCRSPLGFMLKLGTLLSRALGIAVLALAAAVIFEPGLAPGLHNAAGTGGMGGMR